MSEFSNRFKQLKQERKLTLKELSEELDISIPNLSYYMKDREPSYDILINIANYFDVTIDWLIGRTDARSSAHEALDKEINQTIIRNDIRSISEEDIKPLTVFKDDYLMVQEKTIEFLSFYYTLLFKLEELEKLHPEIDYSSINDSFAYNFIEALEYQTDFIQDAQWTILASKPNMYFEYYFNSLSRINLVSEQYKLLISKIIQISTTNFDGTAEQKSLILDFIKQSKNYGQHCISETELSSYLDKLDIFD